MARVSSPQQSLARLTDQRRNVKVAARAIQMQEINDASACATRDEEESRRGADTLLGVDMSA